MDWGAWQDAIHSAEKNRTWLSYWTTTTYWKYSKNTYWIRVYFLIVSVFENQKSKSKPLSHVRPFVTPWTIQSLQARILEWVSLSLLQGIFLTQGSNPGLPHCRKIFYQLSHQGSPRILEWGAYPFFSRSSQLRNQIRVSWIAGGFFTSWAVRKWPWIFE